MSTWAVIIAIEDYPTINGLASHLPDTNVAGQDFRDWLIKHHVPPLNILACAAPTCSWRTTGTSRGEIVDAFADLVKSARDDADELYVFFSGHGFEFSEGADMPPVDILIGSDFTLPADSGGACIRFQELKEKLRITLGPGKHFHFIDACRNPTRKIEPLALGKVWGRSSRGNASTYVLFSTAPGDVASVSSGFGPALVGALQGRQRAKTWVGGKMYVTFESLRTYVQSALGKEDLDSERKGPADGNIVELQPVPTSTCNVEVLDAGAHDVFTLDAADVRKASRNPVTFTGPTKAVAFTPEDYLLKLSTASGAAVVQIDPALDAGVIDLYEDRRVKFQMHPPAQPAPQVGLTPSDAHVRISGIPGAEVSLREIATGLTKTLTMGAEVFTTDLVPGRYMAYLKDGNFRLATQRLDLSPGTELEVDFTPKASKGAQTSLTRSIPTRGALVDFSETLGDVPDWNLGLWLAVLGGARIVDARDSFSKLATLQLETFDDATSGKSVLYVLAGELEGTNVPACDVGAEPTWKPMRPVAEVDSLFETKREFEPGPLLVTYAADDKASTSILVHGLPNRATFLTFARDEHGGQEIQQFILPIHSLRGHLSPRELEYLDRHAPLPLLRYMSTAQRLFALQVPVEGNAYVGSDLYWGDLLHEKWLDPMMGLIACYELIRRGALANRRWLLEEVVGNMRTYFPGIADVDVIALLLDTSRAPPSATPLLMDGLMATGPRRYLPLPEEKIDFTSMWTSWRNAVEMRGTDRHPFAKAL